MSKIDHNKNIIEVKNVSFSYDGEDVFENISLNIHQGDYLGFVGPNGAGKTTLIKIILGLLTPKSGSIKLFGQDLKDFSDWPKISYIPQKTANFEANFPATAEEVVLMGRYGKRGLFHGLTKNDENLARQALEQVGLWEFKNRLISDLSGGQQQRVFIARALAGQPEIIFLDEPTTGVDKKSQDDFYALLQKLNTELGITLILVSHDIERVIKETMHIACINKNLVCHPSPEEFLRESQTAKILGRDVKIIAHHHNR